MRNVTFGDILFIFLTFVAIHGIMRWVYYLRDRKKRSSESSECDQ